MSMDLHLAKLERRHQDLERKIDQARQHPSFDDLELNAMKRQKLYLKEEIFKIQKSVTELAKH